MRSARVFDPPWEVVFRPRFFDASAIVKMCIEEPGSKKVREILAECQGTAHTSWILIAEAFGVLKRLWLKRQLSDESYSQATTRLLIAINVGQLRAVDVADGRQGPCLVAYLPATIELRKKYPDLDVADAIQFRAISEGVLRYSVGESAPKLVSADKRLLEAAQAEGIETIDVSVD